MKQNTHIPKISLCKETLVQVDSLIREGKSNKEIQQILHKNQIFVQVYRTRLNYPCASMIRILNSHPEFEIYFKDLYSKSTYLEIIRILSKHKLFQRKKLSSSRISELKSFYKIQSKMHEEVYSSDYDRIRGYMIRGLKCTAKQRNLQFDLTYKDLELPEACPFLGLKLKYGTAGHFNADDHASIDRIDSSKGYVKGNIMVISRLANHMKSSATIQQLETFSRNCLDLVNNYKQTGIFAPQPYSSDFNLVT